MNYRITIELPNCSQESAEDVAQQIADLPVIHLQDSSVAIYVIPLDDEPLSTY